MRNAIILLPVLLLALLVTGCEKSEESEATQIPEVLVLEIVEPENDVVVEEQEIAVSGMTTPGAVVSINGEVAQVNSSGEFSRQVTLQEGFNSLEILASNNAGSEVRETREVYYMP